MFDWRSRWFALRNAFAVLCLSLSLVGCVSGPEPAKAGQKNYTVKKGDTLYSIAWRNGLDYRELARWNGIGRDYSIYPGQVLRLAPSGQPQRKASTEAPSKPKQIPLPAMTWMWPASGTSSTLTSRPNGGQGLTISGTLGQEVRAAAAGRVVYSGTGLLGYGQLLIIQHNDTYLSAYGHTQTVRVREQDMVQTGQPIATMGAGPNGSPMLYFEIRVNGRPVDPTAYLPK